MKKAVISILGIQNPKYSDNGIAHARDYDHQASYYFEDSSEKPKDYYNTLPLLIEKFSNNYEIIPIYTEDAKLFNQEVLTYANLECSFNDDISLIKEREYFEIFTKIDDLMDLYDEIIVDLTHGFRHLPILAIIDLVIQNFNSTKKIDKILFAKEIVKHTPFAKGEYEIVDLKEYLDIANISFVLSSFENNYTIANHIKTKDKDFQDLINMFSLFSEHIMANSLLNLFKGKNSLVEKMNNAIEAIKITDKVKPILSKLENIQKLVRKFVPKQEIWNSNINGDFDFFNVDIKTNEKGKQYLHLTTSVGFRRYGHWKKFNIVIPNSCSIISRCSACLVAKKGCVYVFNAIMFLNIA